jgi:hypothetical protein
VRARCPRRCDDARIARRISAEGKLIKPGRQTSYAEGFVRDGSGVLAVYPTATFSMAGEGRERNKVHLSQATDAII